MGTKRDHAVYTITAHLSGQQFKFADVDWASTSELAFRFKQDNFLVHEHSLQSNQSIIYTVQKYSPHLKLLEEDFAFTVQPIA